MAQLLLNPNILPDYKLQGVPRKNGKINLGNTGNTRQKIMELIYNSPEGGHSGITTSINRVELMFYWPIFREDFDNMIKKM